MKKMKHMISLMLSFAVVFGAMTPIHAEESLPERIRKKFGVNESYRKPTSVFPEENKAENEQQPAATEEAQLQSGVSDNVASASTDEAITERAAFSPDIMGIRDGAFVYSDSKLSIQIGTIKKGGIVYAVALSGAAMRIAFVSEDFQVIEGFVSANTLSALSKSNKMTYQITARGGRKVYGQVLLPIRFVRTAGSNPAVPAVTPIATPKATATSKITATPTVTATPIATATPKATVTKTPAVAVPKTFPQIVVQPVLVPGGKDGFTTISLKAINTTTFQWQVSTDRGGTWSDLTNGTKWIGNKKSTLYFNPLDKYDGYLFRCRLTNWAGTVYSDSAVLNLGGNQVPEPTILEQPAKSTPTPTVKPTATPFIRPTATPAMSRPVFSVHPQSQAVDAGSLVTLTVSAENATAYQWQYSADQTAWVNLPNDGTWNGLQSEQLSFTALESYHGYNFRAVASNSAGAVLSNSARLTVTAAKEPVIIAQPKDVSAAAGETVRFSVEAENAESYQWYYCTASSSSWKALTDGSGWSGSKTSVLSFTAGASHDGGRFCCVVSDGGKSVNSLTAVLHLLKGAPVFDPTVDTVVKGTIGSRVTLKARVSGATFCQWEVRPKLINSWSNASLSSGTVDVREPSLTIQLNNAKFSMVYRVKATNAYGVAYSPEYTIQELMSAPSNVIAKATGRETVSVSWTASRDTRTRFYRVFFSTDETVNTSQYVDVSGTSTVLAGLSAGTTYHVWVQAVGNVSSSDVDHNVYASATTYAPAVKPASPSSVTANASSTVMTVSWKKPANSEVSGYYVYYAPASANAAQKISVSGETSLSATLTGLSRSTTYQIWVSAYNDAGESNASARITATTLQTAAAPAQPTNVKAAPAAASSVKVTWTLSASADAAGYYVYYGTSSSVNAAARYNSVLSASIDSVTISGLTAGKEYFFWVAAFNSDGAQSVLNAGVRASATPKAVSTANKTNAVQFSMMGDKYIGTSYSTYDCQAFVERMLADAGLNMNLAGSNAWYRTMSWRGTPEQCKATFGCIPTGAFLFIVAYDGGEPASYHDNLGNANHIGVVIHRDLGAIHSSQRKGGVYYSLFQDATIPNGGWNMIGLWTRMDYGDEVNAKLEALTGK